MEEEIIYKVEVQGIASIESLTKANKALREERKKLDIESVEGQQRIKEINQQLDQNTDKIKNNISGIEKQRMAVGGYKDAIKDSIPFFRQAETAQAALTGGMNLFGKALIATGIGVFIAAIALLISYFKRTEEGADLLSKTLDQVGAVFNVIMDRVATLGGALVKLFTGDFIGAIDDTKKAFTGLTEEITKEWQEAGRLSEILDQLEDRERNYSVAASETTLQIKQLRAEAKNRLLTEQEKIDLLTKAFELEKQQNQELLSIRAVGLQAEIDRIKMTDEGAKMTRMAGESMIDFAQRIIANDKIQGDARDELAKKVIEYNEVQGQSLVIQEQINNSIDAQIEKQDAEIAKLAEQISQKEFELELDRIKQEQELEAFAQTEMLKMEQENIDASIAEIAAERDAEKANTDNILTEQQTANLLKTAKLKSELMKQGLTEEQATARIHQMLEEQKLAATSSTLGKAAGAFRENTVAYKAFASAQTIIDTYTGATAAFRAMASIPVVGPILGALAAAATIASGLSNLARINGVQFADGGLVPGFAGGGLSGTRILSGHGLPVKRANGDNRLATVKVGEVILNEQQQARLGGANTFRSIGVPGFAGGGGFFSGLQTSQVARQSEAQSFNRQIFESISNIRPVVTVEDINVGQSRVEVVESNSQVL